MVQMTETAFLPACAKDDALKISRPWGILTSPTPCFHIGFTPRLSNYMQGVGIRGLSLGSFMSLQLSMPHFWSSCDVDLLCSSLCDGPESGRERAREGERGRERERETERESERERAGKRERKRERERDMKVFVCLKSHVLFRGNLLLTRWGGTLPT